MKKVAILLENLFDEKELIYPYYRLLEAGYQVDLIGSEKGVAYKSKVGLEEVSTHSSKEIDASEYDGVVIPGGFSPDYMRRNEDTKKFVREMDKQKKTIGAICHGPWMMASCCDLKGKDITAYPSIKDDLINAGGNYIDDEVIVDGHLITSRTPKDLPIFLKTIIAQLG